MKKPIKEYETEYVISPESESYYGNCESNNTITCGLFNSVRKNAFSSEQNE